LRTSSGVIDLISAWVICPTFCASVMPATIFATRASSAGSAGYGLLIAGQSV